MVLSPFHPFSYIGYFSKYICITELKVYLYQLTHTVCARDNKSLITS